MTPFVLTDAAIERALAPSADVVAPADFTEVIAKAIADQMPRSRPWLLNPIRRPGMAPRLIQLLLLLLLLLVLVVGAIGAASLLRRELGNGNVVVASGRELLTIDPHTGTSSNLLTSEGTVFGVTRSIDGSLISFWTQNQGGTTLEVVSSNGGDRRRVATNLVPSPVGQGQIDVWSPDRRSLAAGVVVDGVQRILVIDIASGNGTIVGPVAAGNPLWSPDGQLLAFSYLRDGRSVLAVMRADGSGLRDISGDLGIFNASGANNWSPDGAWVYFGAERDNFSESHIYRASVDEGNAEQLTFDILSAAPALSPDGTTVAYSKWPGGRGTQNLMLMDADGGNERLLLASAINDGWSNDGQFLLAEWRPVGAPYELMILRSDGTDRRTLMTFEDRCVSVCAKNVAWGQPRP